MSDFKKGSRLIKELILDAKQLRRFVSLLNGWGMSCLDVCVVQDKVNKLTLCLDESTESPIPLISSILDWMKRLGLV